MITCMLATMDLSTTMIQKHQHGTGLSGIGHAKLTTETTDPTIPGQLLMSLKLLWMMMLLFTIKMITCMLATMDLSTTMIQKQIHGTGLSGIGHVKLTTETTYPSIPGQPMMSFKLLWMMMLLFTIKMITCMPATMDLSTTMIPKYIHGTGTFLSHA